MRSRPDIDPILDVTRGPTPQTEPLIGREAEMVERPHGGHVFETDCWTRLERFLILGVEGGTFYQKARDLAKESIAVVRECMQDDEMRTVHTAQAFSMAGKAPRNDQAVYVLACGMTYGSDRCKAHVSTILPTVARTATDLFLFVSYVKAMRGMGHAVKMALQRWYRRPEGDVAYQVTKYRQRNGWSHRDVLRLARPKPSGPIQDAIFGFAVRGKLDLPGGDSMPLDDLQIIRDWEAIQKADGPDDVMALIDGNPAITWEMIPSEKRTPAVWKALLPNIPLEALRRHLAGLTANKALKPLSDETTTVVQRLSSYQAGQRRQLNPFRLLQTIKMYGRGHGLRGSLRWDPVQEIQVALGRALDQSFGELPEMQKRIYLAVDVSGSMSRWGSVAGMDGCKPLDAAAAIATALAKRAPRSVIFGFDGAVHDLGIAPSSSYAEVLRTTEMIQGGHTDAALPFLHAIETNLVADAFILVTDSESWAGHMHVTEALREYRRRINPNVRVVTISMENSCASLADPKDPGMMDTVGFDAATFAGVQAFVEHDRMTLGS